MAISETLPPYRNHEKYECHCSQHDQQHKGVLQLSIEPEVPDSLKAQKVLNNVIINLFGARRAG